MKWNTIYSVVLIFCFTTCWIKNSEAAPKTTQNIKRNEVVHLKEQQLLSRLKKAFGGEKALQKTDSFSYDMIIMKAKKSQLKSHFLDFKQQRMMQYIPDKKERYFVSNKYIEKFIADEKVIAEKAKKERLLNSMKANFLYLLKSPELKMIGPIKVASHKDLSWWKLSVQEHTSPLLGIDKTSGKIRKILFSDGAYIIESNYKPLPNGLIWPHEFRLIENGETVLTGRYANIKINSIPKFKQIPNWFK